MLSYEDAQIVAYALYNAGFEPSCSSDYFEQITAGYGNLDSTGEWQYPLNVLFDGVNLVILSESVN
jgi:hypothetical protein